MTEQIKICKYCGERIPRGELWNPDQDGNGYHHACLINMEIEEETKRVKKLAQNYILNKVRNEIENVEISGNIRDVECFRAGLNVALNIIDKYKG